MRHGNQMNNRLVAVLRVAVAVVAVLLQLLLLFGLTQLLHRDAAYLYLFIEMVGIVTGVVLLNKQEVPAYRMAWILVVVLLPVFGLLLYLLWGRGFGSDHRGRGVQQACRASLATMRLDEEAYERFLHKHAGRVRLSRMLLKHNFPLYDQTQTEYFPVGEAQFERMLGDLERAERFIFMEYFIVGENEVWRRIHEVLKRKAAQGVDIRLLYDDVGSLFTVRDGFKQRMREDGIHVEAFNPVLRYISTLYLNYRNHQKICVIDGNVGYTGGTNLDDEYANLYPKHGHWKDTAVRLTGEGVWSLTVFFLQMWDGTVGTLTKDYDQYRPTVRVASDGFVQPMSDGPANNPGNPGEALFKEMISSAHRYVYLTTPYLVIDDGMVDELCRAAESGVDVRIVTPAHYDHWYVFLVTRSFYPQLIRAGVRIFEYTPGFIHAKMIVSDDDQAFVGTINMDYRSFFLHFEDGVWFCGGTVVDRVLKDVQDIFAVSHEVSLEECRQRPWYYRLASSVFRIFAPMM